MILLEQGLPSIKVFYVDEGAMGSTVFDEWWTWTLLLGERPNSILLVFRLDQWDNQIVS